MTDTLFDIEPRTAAIGAARPGVDSAHVDDALFARLKRALHEHLVLFFHGQT